jgi:hypothetical protein
MCIPRVAMNDPPAHSACPVLSPSSLTRSFSFCTGIENSASYRSPRPANWCRRRWRRPARGIVVCAGIHMSDIPSFPYFRQVAHGEVATTVVPYPLDAANEALEDLRAGRIEGAAVLVPGLHA